MHPDDRRRLEALGFAPDVVERAERVLGAWGEERLFATCADCGRACLVPELPRRKNRLKLPADLFHRRELLGLRARAREVRCMPCDDVRFQ